MVDIVTSENGGEQDGKNSAIGASLRVTVEVRAEEFFDMEEFDRGVAIGRIEEEVSESNSVSDVSIAGPAGLGAIVMVELNGSIIGGEDVEDIINTIEDVMDTEGITGVSSVSVRRWAIEAVY